MSAQATSDGSYLTKNERGGQPRTGPPEARLIDYAAVGPPFRQRILSMKPEHETRRKIIREWMALPKDKRQTEEQAKPFAKKAMERIPSSGDPYRQIMGWLLPRIGKP